MGCGLSVDKVSDNHFSEEVYVGFAFVSTIISLSVRIANCYFCSSLLYFVFFITES